MMMIKDFFRSVFYRSYASEEKRIGSIMQEEFKVPSQYRTYGMRRGDYTKLDTDGLVNPGVRVFGDDVLVGKVSPVGASADEEGRIHKYTEQDCSISLRNSENGVIDQVMLSVNAKGQKFTKVRVRSLRVPHIGDKFASRHGQKGTIGITYSQEVKKSI
jgi:DNA-directed RNA polymerase II subunit RPB2